MKKGEDSLLKKAKLPLILLGILIVIFIFTGIYAKAGVLSWFLEVVPAFIGILFLIITYKKFPMSNWVYWCVFFHSLILVYGGFYTYAATPLGNWAKVTFDLSRNHYDRIGHLAVGLFPVFIIKEVLLRKTKLERNAWLIFIVLSIVLAIAAFWELVEWWTTLFVASDIGQSYLGSQGDIWDAQWDMLLAVVGAIISLVFFSKKHDKSMNKLNLAKK
ncbi:MAG: DUF2238 domain-containing protein [Candidatus Nanoarchaeia archaeon]